MQERETGGDGLERPRTAAARRGRQPASSDGAAGGGEGSRAEGKGRATAVRDARPPSASAPQRLVRFLREVVAELRKVIWPSRRQLVTYTAVVLVFVSFMVALVALLDFLVGQGVNALFGT